MPFGIIVFIVILIGFITLMAFAKQPAIEPCRLPFYVVYVDWINNYHDCIITNIEIVCCKHIYLIQ